MSDDTAIPEGSFTARGKERINLWKYDLADLAKDSGDICTYSLSYLRTHTSAAHETASNMQMRSPQLSDVEQHQYASAIYAAGFLDVHSAALVQLILHTLPLYQDIASQRAVVATIRQAVSNGTFLKTLAGALVKIDAAAVSRQVLIASFTQKIEYRQCQD